jgi:hypothetical protein
MSHWKSSMLPSPRSHAVRSARYPTEHLPLRSLAVLLLTVVSAAFGTPVLAADKLQAKLSVADAVTAPGRAILLEARLVRSGNLIETGLGGEPVEFLISNRKIGTTMTGGDGRAYLEYTPKMRGNQTLTVRLGPSTRVEASEATATVAAWEKRRPILLIEQSALLKESAGGPLPGLGLGISHQDPAEETDAASELKKLAEFYFNLVYVERPGDKVPEGLDLRDWLQRHGFPFGLRMKIKDGKSAALAERLTDLQAEGWENLKAGVGRSREFAEGLLQHRLRVIVLTQEKVSDLPRKAQPAKDWREARKLLQG